MSAMLPVKRSKAAATAREILDECWTPTGLVLTDEKLPFKVYEEIGFALGALRDMTAWGLGDWIISGEMLYGDKYAQAVTATGRSVRTLQLYRQVALYVPPKRRRKKLTFSHHVLVAKRTITPDDQDRWLNEAEERGWSVEEMQGAMSALPNGNGAQTSASQYDDVDPDRVLTIAKRITREANPLGDGRHAVNSELIAQLRAALGQEDR